MKANKLQQLMALKAVNMLVQGGNHFVPMPVKSHEHLIELNKQARQVILDLAIEDGEDTTSIISSISEEDAKQVEAAEARKAMRFFGMTAEELIGTFSDMHSRLVSMMKEMAGQIDETRATAKLGESNGFYAFLVFTDSKDVYDVCETAAYENEVPTTDCGNPDCLDCNPTTDSESVSSTIH